jgi:hypothetical protein
MSNSLKLELLNEALDTNGIGLNLPADAIGVVGGAASSEFQVTRNGQAVSVKPGDVLLKGDIIRTGSTTQTIFLSSTQAVALTKVALAPNQQLTLDTDAELALEGDLVEVAATEALNPELLAMADETTGLFGALGAASIAGVPAAGVAAGGLAVAALSGGSGGGSGNGEANSGNNNNNNGTVPDVGNGDNNNGTPAEPSSGGPLSSGGAQLDALFADNPTGQTPPLSFADGAAMLEGILPIPAASADSNPLGLPFELSPQALTQIPALLEQADITMVLQAVSAALPAQVTDVIDTVAAAATPVSANAGLPGSDLLQPVLNLI